MSCLSADNQGTNLTYLDSGAPSSSQYITIFAVHGLGFTAHVFEKVISIAPSYGVRFVAVNRRNYGGSTPFSDDEAASVEDSSTDEQRLQFCAARGKEIMTFIDNFIKKHDIPELSPDRKSGGFALLGWSLGGQTCSAAVAHIDDLPSETQVRLSSRLRTFILLENPSSTLGFAFPPEVWFPQIDTSIPMHLRLPFFVNWITSYWDHDDIDSRDLKNLSIIVPSPNLRPSIYNMSAEQRKLIIDDSVLVDQLYFAHCSPQARADFQKACYDPTIKALLPNMKIVWVSGDKTTASIITTYYSLLEEEEKRGGGTIDFKTIPGGNHFSHWDSPETVLPVLLDVVL